MDVEQLLRSTDLPEVPVGTSTDDALASTVRRGRGRQRRRLAVVGACAVLVAGGATFGLVHRDDPADVRTGTPTSPPSVPEPGDPATWSVDPSVSPSSSSSTFTAQVRRLGCNSGVTGKVLRPGVVATGTEVVVTFTVEADPDGGACPTNDEVPYEVDLGQPLGDRTLVDGACSPGGSAVDTTLCSEEGVRWRPSPGSTPTAHECAAEEGSATDVAHEPDWRQYADYTEWTDREGCLVRIDVVAERPGPDHCGWQNATVLITGQPLGARYTGPGDHVEYVRDPDGVFGDPAFPAGFDPDASLPDGAVDSGYTRGDDALWYDPDDPSAIWLVGPEHVERWPAGESPLCE